MGGKASWRYAAVVIVAAALVVPVAGVRAATSEASALPARLVGAWNRNVKSNASLPGVWTMVIAKSGVVHLYTPGGYKPGCTAKKTCVYTLTSHFSVTGQRLNVGAFTGVFAVCGTKATYGWKVSGQSLTLKVISDTDPTCSAARKALLGGVWKQTRP